MLVTSMSTVWPSSIARIALSTEMWSCVKDKDERGCAKKEI